MSDDGVWTVSATPLGDDEVGAVDLVVSGALGRWLEAAPGRAASGEWRALGDGRYVVVLRLGGVDVDAVLRREGDAYVGRAVARAAAALRRPGEAPRSG